MEARLRLEPKRMLRRAARAAAASPLGWGLRCHLVRTGVIVLTYHRIGTTDDGLAGLDESLFRAHMEWIRANCTLIAPDELRARAAGPSGRRPPALVTFDDGYRDYRERAYPILRELGIPALVFLTTAFIDEPDRLFWWESLTLALRRTHAHAVELPWERGVTRALSSPQDRVRLLRDAKAHLKSVSETEKREAHQDLLRRLDVVATDLRGPRRMLTWDDVRATRDLTVYGGHSHSHALLSKVDEDGLEAEVRGCRDRITAEIGDPPRYFAYPNGEPSDFTDAVKESLCRHGFDTAFTTIEGVVRADVDWMAVPRFPGHGDVGCLVWGILGLTRKWSSRRA